MTDDLLTPEDPFFPHVRRAAVTSAKAFAWYQESAVAWARGEFIRRAPDGDVQPEDIDNVLTALNERQVAVLTSYLQLGDSRHRGSRWTVLVGMLIDGNSTREYLHMNLGMVPPDSTLPHVMLAGMYDVYDVFELPKAWRLEKWPTFPDPDPPMVEGGPSRPLPTTGTRLDSSVQLRSGDSVSITERLTLS